MNMNQNTNIFAQRLKSVLSASGVERGELARHLGVSVPTVNRWLNGISTPNVYQFRAIAHFFGLPYEWFTEDEGGIPNVDDLAVKLGLSPETVEALLDMVSEGCNEAAFLSQSADGRVSRLDSGGRPAIPILPMG